ncbi:MarR family winged helix-turn-helix transcriptional regulator [Aestuariispira ectoiniformans]|uniref:MarR family winged helix-turn-helix transcriptional regulator n=1 Tax=Aestuariispira ectoiniformans TaxID=2775080 RepID=UPI00223AC6A5|nr:MarR family transcriptional regulator [Aestuariispira ectoiniformans]
MGEGTDNALIPEKSLGYASRMTHRAFARSLQRRLAKHGVPIGQWHFLRILWLRDGLTQKDLSDELGIMGPTAVVALRAMEKNGLINRIRNEDDRRKVNIFLTDKGRALKDDLTPYVDEINQIASQGIPNEDLEVYKRVSTKFRENLAEYDR